ncbi:MAG: hypothetical protein ACT4P6_10500 [Gemmatimonadaceae bacterium]
MPNKSDELDTHELGGDAKRLSGLDTSLRRDLTSRMGLLGTMAVLGFAVAAAVTWSRGWPALPVVHDEASFVLAGDTFAKGRLTNPTPPFPEHFDTFHVLLHPSYASKYPPAQGVMLAVGQVLTGQPIVGVWLSTAIFCAALAWMLLGWFPARWAVWGTVLTIAMLVGGGSQHGYWMSTYWGGMVAATGAALVYGAIRRITWAPTTSGAVLFALGLAILVLSRPFEGALAALPALAVAAAWLARNANTTLAWRLRHVVAPFAVVLAVLGSFSLMYNYRVTGNAFRLPYAEYERQYSNIPVLLFSGRKPPETRYANDEMRRFYDRQHEARAEKRQSLRAIVRTELERSAEIKRLLAPGLTLILLVAAATSRLGRSLVLPATGAVLVLAGALAVTWFFPHYIAPVIAPWAILLTAGAERISTLEPPPGRTGVLITLLILGVTAASALFSLVYLRQERSTRRASWVFQRDSLARALQSKGTKHLVLVSYGRKHSTHEEWVHNAADLNETKVLWARSLAPEKDARLMQHFRDRTPWKVHVDSGGPKLLAITDSSHAELGKQ